MPGRGDICVYKGSKNKKESKIKCLLQKVDMFNKLDKQWALLWWTPLGWGLNAVVPCFTKENEHKIRKSVKVSAPWSAKFLV